MTTRRLFEIILFAALFVMATREITDPDFWWHLRTGQFIVETRTIPHTDIYSFTNNGKEWVTHEWLSEVLIYLLYRAGGFGLLIVSFAATITGAFLIVYSRCAAKPFVAGFALLLGALAAAPTWGVRPQMFSVLLTSVFLYLLDRYESGKDRRFIIALIPLTVLWVNLHSGFALGLAIIGICIVGSLVEQFVRRTERNSPSATRDLIMVFVLCLLAVMLNPNGARMYTYPIETLTSRAMQSFIQEWFSPDLHRIEFQPFALLLLATLAAALWSRTRVSLTQLLLLAAFAYAGLRSARHIPLFALVAIPVLTFQLQDLARLSLNPLRPTPKLLGRINAALVGVILLAGSVRVAAVISNQTNVERTKFPGAAVDLLASRKSESRIFNLYHWGGYLIWRMYPDCPVFIDGRADVYGDQFFEEFARIYGAEPGWEDELAKRDVNLALVEPDSAIAQAMLRTGHWQEIFKDEQSVVLERE